MWVLSGFIRVYCVMGVIQFDVDVTGTVLELSVHLGAGCACDLAGFLLIVENICVCWL